MPVEVVRTLRASGGDYTSIQAWDNAEARDLVSADEIAVLECYNDWPGGLNGRFSSSDSSWVCDTDHYPWIRSAPGSGTNGPNHHGGIPGAGFVAYSTHNTYDAFQFGTKFRITGLEFRFAGSNTSRRAIYDKANSTGWILEEVITVGPAEFHASSQVAGAGYVRNVLHIKTASDGNLLTGRGASNSVYNSTFVAIEGATNGIYLNFSNFSISVTNSVFVGATNDVRPDISASIFTVQNCATTNSEGMSNFPGTGHVYGINPGTAFVDALEWDFRLSENSPLRGAGANLSHLFDIDIAGNTRGDSWDIGAFQISGTGGGSEEPIEIDAETDSLTISEKSFNLSVSKGISAASDEVIITENSFSITIDTTISTNPDTVTITGKKSSIDVPSFEGIIAVSTQTGSFNTMSITAPSEKVIQATILPVGTGEVVSISKTEVSPSLCDLKFSVRNDPDDVITGSGTDPLMYVEVVAYDENSNLISQARVQVRDYSDTPRKLQISTSIDTAAGDLIVTGEGAYPDDSNPSRISWVDRPDAFGFVDVVLEDIELPEETEFVGFRIQVLERNNYTGSWQIKNLVIEDSGGVIASAFEDGDFSSDWTDVADSLSLIDNEVPLVDAKLYTAAVLKTDPEPDAETLKSGTDPDLVDPQDHEITSTGTFQWDQDVDDDSLYVTYAVLESDGILYSVVKSNDWRKLVPTEIDTEVDDVVFIENSSTIKLSVNLSAVSDDISLSEKFASVLRDTSISASADDVVIEENSATLIFDLIITAGNDNVVIMENKGQITAQVDVSIDAALDELFLSENKASIFAEDETSINASNDVVLLVEKGATLSFDIEINATADAISLMENNAVIQSNVEQAIQASFDNVYLVESPATVTRVLGFTAGMDSLTLDEYTSSVELSFNFRPLVQLLTVTENASSVVYNITFNVPAGTDEVVVTESPAFIRLLSAVQIEGTCETFYVYENECVVTFQPIHKVKAKYDIIRIGGLQPDVSGELIYRMGARRRSRRYFIIKKIKDDDLWLE